mmetsp:Transcript_80230/g.250103  ORF Transcript_80230/g.250103 Transcript_80230/m.250103 type:complete len:209 (-) Transcript_80230:798-1424(-)
MYGKYIVAFAGFVSSATSSPSRFPPPAPAFWPWPELAFSPSCLKAFLHSSCLSFIARCPSSASTTSVFLFVRAKSMAVWPRLACRFMSASASNRDCTASALPWPAAHISGVKPPRSAALTSAISRTSAAMMVPSPAEAAMCNGVRPRGLAKLRSARPSTSRSTASRRWAGGASHQPPEWPTVCSGVSPLKSALLGSARAFSSSAMSWG